MMFFSELNLAAEFLLEMWPSESTMTSPGVALTLGVWEDWLELKNLRLI